MAGAPAHPPPPSRPPITTGAFTRTADAPVAADGWGATPSPEGDVTVCSRIASRATAGMTGAPVDLVGRLDRSYGERVGQVPVVTRTEQVPRGVIPGGSSIFKSLVVLREQAGLDRGFAVEHQVTSLEPCAAQGQRQDFVQVFHEVHLE